MARNRYSDEKVLVTANNAKLIAEGVYKIAAEFERLSGLMGEFKSGGVEAGGLKSALVGLEQLSSFCGSVQKAYVQSVTADQWRGVPDAILILQNTIDRVRAEAIDPEKQKKKDTPTTVQAKVDASGHANRVKK